MNEFIEKLIGRLEEYKYSHLVERDKERLEHCTENERAEHCEGIDCFWCVFEKAIEIVNQLAEEYGKDTNVTTNNGWISVEDRLPEESLNSVLGWDEYRKRCCFVQYIGGRWVLGNDIDSVKIIAWQPLPKYEPKGE